MKLYTTWWDRRRYEQEARKDGFFIDENPYRYFEWDEEIKHGPSLLDALFAELPDLLEDEENVRPAITRKAKKSSDQKQKKPAGPKSFTKRSIEF